jgi:hypothetical protein
MVWFKLKRLALAFLISLPKKQMTVNFSEKVAVVFGEMIFRSITSSVKIGKFEYL